MTGDMAVPCIIYVLPLIPLINRAIKYGRDYLDFHILGGATYRDILFYELFKKVVMDKHKIKLNITYDSSTIFKGLMVGRHVNIMDNGVIRKTDLRSPCLDKRFNSSDMTIEEKFIETIGNFAKKYGFKELDHETIYSKETNTFYDPYRLYSMFYLISMYSEIEDLMRVVADEAYPIYLSGDHEHFNNIIENVTRKLNSNKITKKQTVKSYSICKSLNMLVDLDEDYCEYITNKFLVKDEFLELTNKKLLEF